MACLKCGKETGDAQIFCGECKQIMEQYPVKPGTPIQLPQRAVSTAEKKATHKKKQTLEQQIAQLRLVIRWLGATALTLLLLVCLLIFLLLK